MDNDEQAQSRIPFTQLDQIDSDFNLAIIMQEQERAFTSIETDSDDTETTSSGSSDDEIFQIHGFEEELGFLDGENRDIDEEEMEEDEIDHEIDDEIDDESFDELSYEELIAITEIIGEEKRGLPENKISSCLKSCSWQFAAERERGVDRCVICQVEYGDGEAVVLLPCEHPYHTECISQWLQIRNNCPICSLEVSSTKNNVNI